MVQVLVSKQDGVFDEDGTGSQDEGREQVDVDVVSGAAELSGKWKRGQGRRTLLYSELALYFYLISLLKLKKLKNECACRCFTCFTELLNIKEERKQFKICTFTAGENQTPSSQHAHPVNTT